MFLKLPIDTQKLLQLSWIGMYISWITGDLRPPWVIKAQFNTRLNWAFETMVFLAYCCLKDEYTAGGFYEKNEWHLVGKLMIKRVPGLP